MGRKQSKVNHSAKEYVRHEDGVLITPNTVEGYFSILKRENYGIYHHRSSSTPISTYASSTAFGY